MKIEIIESCNGFAGAKHETGEIVDLAKDQADELVASGRAKYAPADSPLRARKGIEAAEVAAAVKQPEAETAKRRR